MPTQEQRARRLLEAILKNPEHFDWRESAFVYATLGPDTGLLLINRALERKADPVAEGVAVSWRPAYDEVYWSLREYPRARPRRPLTCLVPGDELDSTRIDLRLTYKERQHLKTHVLPVLLLDRDKEVRRRARIASLLAELPGAFQVPFHDPPFRWMEWAAGLYRDLPIEEEWEDRVLAAEAEEPPEVSDVIRELNAPDYYDTVLPDELVQRALTILVDVTIAPEHRDHVSRYLFWRSKLTSEQLEFAIDFSGGDRDVTWSAAYHPRADATVWARALRHRPDDLSIIGCAVNSREALQDIEVLRILSSSENPHVLYTLARAGVVGTMERAFRSLVTTDVERAVRLLEFSRNARKRLEVSPRELSTMLELAPPPLRYRIRRLRL